MHARKKHTRTYEHKHTSGEEISAPLPPVQKTQSNHRFHLLSLELSEYSSTCVAYCQEFRHSHFYLPG